MPLSEEEVKADAMADALTIDELAEFLTEGTFSLRNLTTRYLSLCKAALVILSTYNWVPSSHKNAVSADRARLIYKMFHGIKVDAGEMFYARILNLAVLQKEGEKKDTRWLILPRIKFGVLQTQFELERKPREKLSPLVPYKKDLSGQAKKKGKSASTSTATPSSGPPPSTPQSERTAPSGYVPPRQPPRAAGKFQIIHLGSIAAPGQPIDAEEAKLALDTTFEAIQQLTTAMRTLTSVVGQIASMLFPRYICLNVCGCLSGSVQVLERHPKLKGGDCRCKDQMDVLIQTQVQHRREQSLQQRSVRADEQVKMKIAT
ncbi:hypothetical protein F2Q68_00044735 [Brassica cretica]|uniref:Uncharacterized protein n=1 Tax=Brassica cretica TaxID=69181 RepID=A0A8S9LNF4_BRACR|nr:hypothetical protein F2Q68_00044735 [Brassica cretica]